MKDDFSALMERAPKNFPHLNSEMLRLREPMESDPKNYTTVIYPPSLMEKHRPDPTEKFYSLVSAYIDFRNTAPAAGGQVAQDDDAAPTKKNVIWAGMDHREIMSGGAKFEYDQYISDYMVGLKIHYDKHRRRILIARNKIGQSCERTEEHIEKIADAAETALNRDIVNQDAAVQKKFFLEDYGLGHISDLSDKKIYSEIDAAEKTGAEPTQYDLALLAPIEIDSETTLELKTQGGLHQKIRDLLPLMSKTGNASIRIPYHIKGKAGHENVILGKEIDIMAFASDFERSHEGLACQMVRVRDASKYRELPDESWGYILIARDTT